MTSKFHSLLVKIAVYLSVLTSGSLYYQAYYDDLWLIILLLLSFYLYLYYKGKCLYRNSATNFLFLITIIFYFHAILNHHYLFSYVGLFTRIFLSYLLISFLKEKYFDIMTNFVIFLAASSLLLYIDLVFFKVISPFLGSRLPNIRGWQGIERYNYLLIITSKYPLGVLRNQSIFWEPGAFQFFLNIALIFNIEKGKKLITLKNIVLIVTIISTFSTTGYIVLGLILINYNFKINKFRSSIMTNFLLFIVLSISIISIYNSQTVIEKLNYGHLSFHRRIYDTTVDLNIIKDYPILGIGFGSQDKWMESAYLGGSSSSNSLTNFICEFGVIISLIYLLPLFNIKLQFITKYIWCLIIIILLSTENFIFTPLILIIMFYSLYKNGIIRMPNKAKI